MSKGLLWLSVLTTGYLLFLPASALAQFSDTVHYRIVAAGTGNLNRTATGSNYLFNNSVGLDIDKKYFSLNSSAAHIYGKNPSAKTNDDFNASMNLDVLRGIQKFYYWALAGYEKSFSLKVDNRFQTGAGVGYKFFDQPKSSLIVSNGLLFETADLSQADQYGRTDYQTLRNSLRVKLRFVIANIVTVDGSNFIQNSLSEGDDYIIRFNNSLSVQLYRWINLTAAFNYNKFNSLNTENLFLSYGIRFERFF